MHKDNPIPIVVPPTHGDLASSPSEAMLSSFSAVHPFVFGEDNKTPSAGVQKLLDYLSKKHIRLVVFDWDLTALTFHSHGRALENELEFFYPKLSADFLTIVKQLERKGTQIAIASFSSNDVPSPWVGGTRFIQAVLDKAFPEFSEGILIAAALNANTKKGLEQSKLFAGKLSHLCHLMNLYDEIYQEEDLIEPSQVALIDDDLENVVLAAAYGFVGIHSESEQGLQANNIRYVENPIQEYWYDSMVELTKIHQEREGAALSCGRHFPPLPERKSAWPSVAKFKSWMYR